MTHFLFAKHDRAERVTQRMKSATAFRGHLRHVLFSGNGFTGTLSHHGVYADSPTFESRDGQFGIAIDGWAALGTKATPELLERCSELYAREGIHFVRELNGAFNLVVWDKQRETVYFANDRYGLRPVFRLTIGGMDLIGSSIISLLQTSDTTARLNLFALFNLLSFSRVWAGDETLFEAVHAVPPASILTWKGHKHYQETYWDYAFSPQDSRSEDDVVEFAHEFRAAIQRHLPPQSPFGLFLSGGLDSRGHSCRNIGGPIGRSAVVYVGVQRRLL